MGAAGIFILGCLFTLFLQIECKYCYFTGSETSRYYYCGAYEYCCDGGCCESFISFYRLWYFWLVIILVLMFCSGGGYWYRKRYVQQRVVVSQSPHAPTIIATGTTNQGAVLPDSSLWGHTPSGSHNENPPTYNQAAFYPEPYSGQQNGVFVATQGVYYHPTQYSQPPPSYESVYKNPTAHGKTPANPSMTG